MKYKTAIVMLLLISAGTITLSTGCVGKLSRNSTTDENELIIPDFPTAQQQFQFARMYQNNQLIAPEIDRRRVQMRKIGECYQRVLTNFPGDTTYVPLTYLELGDGAAQSDELDLAIDYYQQAGTRSQDEFVQARSQYSIARIYDTKGQFTEAKAMYKNILDRYGQSESGKVRDVVNRAAQLYVQVHEKKR